ncbi:hypothetical protein F5880DRAFT_482584 [Lentinula raphanica]|nr:hypothetical protein F5880DRAFT_482584 [Lentinula raphanica]
MVLCSKFSRLFYTVLLSTVAFKMHTVKSGPLPLADTQELERRSSLNFIVQIDGDVQPVLYYTSTSGFQAQMNEDWTTAEDNENWPWAILPKQLTRSVKSQVSATFELPDGRTTTRTESVEKLRRVRFQGKWHLVQVQIGCTRYMTEPLTGLDFTQDWLRGLNEKVEKEKVEWRKTATAMIEKHLKAAEWQLSLKPDKRIYSDSTLIQWVLHRLLSNNCRALYIQADSKEVPSLEYLVSLGSDCVKLPDMPLGGDWRVEVCKSQ